jgi:hypothetical protein
MRNAVAILVVVGIAFMATVLIQSDPEWRRAPKPKPNIALRANQACVRHDRVFQIAGQSAVVCADGVAVELP